MEEKAYWLALQKVAGIGPIKLKRLIDYFGSAKIAWNANQLDLVGMDKGIADNLLAARKRIFPEKEWTLVEKHKIKVLTIKEKEYPNNLKEIYAPPPILYLKGELLEEDNRALGVVGSRKASFYGLKIAEQLCSQLVENKITIVSGLARGIDTAAHQGAVKNSGRTMAVLGCGLDIIYPPENKKLSERILESGAIISEFPVGTPPEASNFPRRNRIISGLSLGVLVVEAAKKSGSLITVDFALEQGREVFAVPGMITSKESEGTNGLIKQGAKLVQGVEDIFEELGLSQADCIKPKSDNNLPSLSKEEKIVLNILGNEPKHLDHIIRETKLDFAEVFKALLELEMNNLVIQLPGKMFLRS